MSVNLTDQIRQAINRSGRSRNSICVSSGIDPAVLSRFMAGKAGLSLDTLDALAKEVGLNITTRPAKLSPRSKRKAGEA